MSAPEALMKRVLLTLAACVAAALLAPRAGAASVSKTYSYFTIGGVTLEEIETELNTRGPHVNSTGRRHPGATQMEFTTRLGYTTTAKGCSLTKVQVTVDAKVILPRWRHRSTASGDTALVWDTLSADIKRHEESHVSIAKNHGRELEDQLKAIGRQKDCETVAARAKVITDQVLARHDAAQDRFDRIEGINFESRLLRLLQYRIGNASAKRPEG
jgi:predicted secreted Zn-dependent protease